MADPLSQLGVALQAALDQELTKALTLASGTATSLPDSLQDASHTLVLTGTVLPQASDADPTQVVVQTSAGQVSLSLSDAASLPKGAITLVVQPATGGNPPEISIVAQQRPATAPVAQTDTAASAQIQLAQPQVQAAIPTLAAGQTVTATLLPDAVRQASAPPPQPSSAPAAASSGQGTAAPVQSTGTLLQNAVRPADAAPPGPAYATLLQQSSVSPVQAAAIEEVAEPVTPVAPQTQAAPQQLIPDDAAPALSLQPPPPTDQPGAGIATPQSSLVAGPPSLLSGNPLLDAQAEPVAQAATYAAQPQTANFLVLQVTNPGEAASPPAEEPAGPPQSSQTGQQPAPGGSFTATVIGQSISQQPLLSSPQGGLLLSRPAGVEVGAQVTLQRVSQSQTTTAGPTQPAAPLTLQTAQAGGRPGWPALTQLLGALQQDKPEIAARLTDGLPNLAASGFAKAFASFLVPGGTVPLSAHPELSLANTERPLPDSEARLVQTLVRQLQDDLGTVARAATAPVRADEWRTHLVPIANGFLAETVQLHVRHQPDDPALGDEADHRTSVTTRFLVEVAPRHIGPVQLDGLLRQLPQQPRRLDLVIRTATELGDAANEAMSGLFQTALVNSGLQGSVRFQAGHDHFVQAASGVVHQVDSTS